MTTIQNLKHIAAADWAAFAVNQVAYVKRVTGENSEAAYAIHAADGTPLAILGDRDLAVAAVRQHDLEPVSVH